MTEGTQTVASAGHLPFSALMNNAADAVEPCSLRQLDEDGPGLPGGAAARWWSYLFSRMVAHAFAHFVAHRLSHRGQS